MGMYNKGPDQIKLEENFNLFKKDLNPFCCNISFILLINSYPFNFQVCECIIVVMIW
jgi:hypothetical protein